LEALVKTVARRKSINRVGAEGNNFSDMKLAKTRTNVTTPRLFHCSKNKRNACAQQTHLCRSVIRMENLFTAFFLLQQ